MSSTSICQEPTVRIGNQNSLPTLRSSSPSMSTYMPKWIGGSNGHERWGFANGHCLHPPTIQSTSTRCDAWSTRQGWSRLGRWIEQQRFRDSNWSNLQVMKNKFRSSSPKGETRPCTCWSGPVRDCLRTLSWGGSLGRQRLICRFLLARYHVTWHRFRGLDHPLRIGDVLVLPITGFSPGGEKDFGAEGSDSPQANVIHNCEHVVRASLLTKVRGSWKSDGQ